MNRKLDISIDIDANNAFVYRGLGSLFNKQRKYDKAIEKFKKAIKIKPDYARAYNNMTD